MNLLDFFLKPIARLLAFLMGWQFAVDERLPEKCVIIGAHHTTNWDLVIALMLKYNTGIDFHWVGKDEAFVGPIGWLFRSLGGVPVNRRQSTGFVDQLVKIFDTREVFRLVIVPKGTRRAQDYWKTGFYYIALGAGVPLAFGYADYRRKVAGIESSFQPSGDIEADMETIRAFYRHITPKFPKQAGAVLVKSCEEKQTGSRIDAARQTQTGKSVGIMKDAEA